MSDKLFERAVNDWLEDGSDRTPRSAIDGVLLAVRTTRQERGLALPWSLPTLNPPMRLAGAAIVAVLAIGIALLALRPTSNVGPSSPSAKPSPTVRTLTYPTRPPNVTLTQGPYFPASPLPNPANDPLPTELIGRTYVATPPEVQGTQTSILTLRAADDPHCAAMFEGRSTCFTYLWTPNYPMHITDPGARGAARVIGDQLVLSFDLVPFGAECEGESATYAIESAGTTLTGLRTPACTVPGFEAITLPTN